MKLSHYIVCCTTALTLASAPAWAQTTPIAPSEPQAEQQQPQPQPEQAAEVNKPAGADAAPQAAGPGKLTEAQIAALAAAGVVVVGAAAGGGGSGGGGGGGGAFFFSGGTTGTIGTR